MLLLGTVPNVPLEQLQSVEQHPIPYFLLVTFSVVGVLWGALSTVVWWAARTQKNLFRELLEKEEKASAALRHERDEVRTEHMRDLVALTLATQGLLRIRDEYLALKEELSKKRKAAP